MRPRRLDRGIRLFDHPLLDWASRVHPTLPLLFWGPIAVAALIFGAWGLDSLAAVVGWLVVGLALWLVSEYAIHRWFFHFRPRRPWLRRMFYYVHEHHHRYQERDRLLAPPLMSLAIGAVLIALAFPTLRHWLGVWPTLVVAGGFIAGYLAYDYTHFIIHFTKPRSRWGRFLRRCHFEHHFQTPNRWFCISFPLLDYAFRTQGRRGRKSPAAADDWDDESLPPKVREYEAGLRASAALGRVDAESPAVGEPLLTD